MTIKRPSAVGVKVAVQRDIESGIIICGLMKIAWSDKDGLIDGK